MMKIVTLGLALLGIIASTSSFAGAPILKATPALLEKGKTSYAANCVSCHGDKGDGAGPAGMYMNPKPRNFTADAYKAGAKPEQVFKTITSGLPNTAMAGYGHIPEEERWALTHYVLSFKAKK